MKTSDEMRVADAAGKIPSGVFSRFYSFDGESASVAYHTPSQTVSFFEGHSAEVWWRIFNGAGSTEEARSYILQNGEFEGVSDEGVRTTLADFLDQLKKQNLFTSLLQPPTAIAQTESPPSREDADDPDLAINRFMANHSVLFGLAVEVTYRCNENCIHCCVPKRNHGAELSMAQLDAVLGEFCASGGLRLLLTGGEPLFRKDFVDILGLARKHQLATSLITNLTLFNEEILDAITALSPHSVGCAASILLDRIYTIGSRK